MSASQIAPPIIIRAGGIHSASLIFFHGLGDQGDGWASVFRNELSLSYMKYIFPNAQSRPVTLNFGMRMPAWFDIMGLNPSSPEDEPGIEKAKNYVHGLINEEIASGIPCNRIALGGFSMGGALALYAGLTYDGTLGCIISLSGFMLQRNKIPGGHKANLKTPIFLGHGREDFIVPYIFGQMTEQMLKTFNPNVKFNTYTCQHGSTMQEHSDILEFIKTHIPEDAVSSHSADRIVRSKL